LAAATDWKRNLQWHLHQLLGLVTGLATDWQYKFEMVLVTALGKHSMMNQNFKSNNQLVVSASVQHMHAHDSDSKTLISR